MKDYQASSSLLLLVDTGLFYIPRTVRGTFFTWVMYPRRLLVATRFIERPRLFILGLSETNGLLRAYSGIPMRFVWCLMRVSGLQSCESIRRPALLPVGSFPPIGSSAKYQFIDWTTNVYTRKLYRVFRPTHCDEEWAAKNAVLLIHLLCSR